MRPTVETSNNSMQLTALRAAALLDGDGETERIGGALHVIPGGAGLGPD